MTGLVPDNVTTLSLLALSLSLSLDRERLHVQLNPNSFVDNTVAGLILPTTP